MTIIWTFRFRFFFKNGSKRAAFRGLREKLDFWTFALSTGFIEKELMSILGRKLINLVLNVDWMVLKIYIKYLLNALAISAGLVYVILLLIPVEET